MIIKEIVELLLFIFWMLISSFIGFYFGLKLSYTKYKELKEKMNRRGEALGEGLSILGKDEFEKWIKGE
jgi:mannose/fructose/N-acetylgalactosamine-specific phosphotransferase system component IID